jgi:hypothetical protein
MLEAQKIVALLRWAEDHKINNPRVVMSMPAEGMYRVLLEGDDEAGKNLLRFEYNISLQECLSYKTAVDVHQMIFEKFFTAIRKQYLERHPQEEIPIQIECTTT